MSAREVILEAMTNASHCESDCRACTERLDVYLAALSAAGYVIVPREPTDAMTLAGGEAQQTSIGSWGEPALVWRHMLAALQPIPAQETDK